MGINLDRMAQDRAKAQKSADEFKAPVGDTAVYIAPPARDDDDLPYLEVMCHWGLGKSGQMAICQDPLNQPLMYNKYLVALAKERGLAIEKVKIGKDSKDAVAGGCAVCRKLDEGALSDRQKAKRQWLWIVVPLLTRADARKPFSPWPDVNAIMPYFSSFTVWTGFVDQFAAGGDITNPDGASLVRIMREGKGQTDTKYNIQPHMESFKTPIALSQSLRDALASDMAPGEKCDPYKVIATKLRTPEDVEKMMAGTPEGDDYEQDPGQSVASEPAAGTHAAPGAKAATAAKPAAKAPPTNSKPAAAPAKPAPASKPAPAKVALKSLPKAELEKPACFGLDPDAGEKICQDCPVNKECFDKCGVDLPGAGAAAAEASEVSVSDETVADEVAHLSASECTAGQVYLVTVGADDVEATYKGPAKGKHLFVQNNTNTLLKLEAADAVKQMVTAEEAAV